MATNTSSIDDVLMTSKAKTQPETPEFQPELQDYDSPKDNHSDDILDSKPQYDSEPEPDEPVDEKPKKEAKPEKESESDDVEYDMESDDGDVDDYGNEKPESKMYTEAEKNEAVNKAVRERLARLERNNQTPTQQEVQQQTKQDFEYNPDSNQSYEQQLESFVEQTVVKMSQKQAKQKEQQREQQAQQEFETKFHDGMSKFNDFVEVVGNQPITDAMTVATRAMKDPAAFLYAASKRNSQELQRISQIQDPYTQMVEMGRLEERMRKSKTTTKAPRPVTKTTEDASIPQPKERKEPSIEDLIASADRKRRAKLESRRRR